MLAENWHPFVLVLVRETASVCPRCGLCNDALPRIQINEQGRELGALEILFLLHPQTSSHLDRPHILINGVPRFSVVELFRNFFYNSINRRISLLPVVLSWYLPSDVMKWIWIASSWGISILFCKFLDKLWIMLMLSYWFQQRNPMFCLHLLLWSHLADNITYCFYFCIQICTWSFCYGVHRREMGR